MLPRRLFLDFGAERISGQETLGHIELRHGKWNCEGFGGELPAALHSLSDAPLHPVELALNWCNAKAGPKAGAIGFVGYEAGFGFDGGYGGLTHPASATEPPDLRLAFYARLVREPQPSPPPPSAVQAVPERAADRAWYVAGVEEIQERIRAGDIYQANLTLLMERACDFTPDQFYERLRKLGPARWGALLEWPDFAVVSHSPESFLEVGHNTVVARPIKGTIGRGTNDAEDAMLRHELLHSEKDRAENVMIVDLLRNDLGRVCQPGTISVPKLFELITLRGLHHLVSTVEGQLASGNTALDAFCAAFPCGSITGAPKLKAMEILSRLEGSRRGPCMGSIGYLGCDGSMAWNVAIRTAVLQNGLATFRVGAGIVADSCPEHEYREVLLKASALWFAAGPEPGAIL